ncbi:MAG: hypothetical protein WAO83_15845 [Fuerstiella sp.]
MTRHLCNVLRHRWFRRSVAALLFCCSVFWLAGPVLFLVATVPGPAGDVSMRVDQFGYVFQQTTSGGDAPFFRVISQQNAGMPDWSETTADASGRLMLPGIIAANWNAAGIVVTRTLCLRHWLIVPGIAGLLLLSLVCGRSSPIE